MSEYALGSEAELDLDVIWEYIAADSIDVADHWIAKLFDAFESLAQTPGIGHKREDLTRFCLILAGGNLSCDLPGPGWSG